MRRACLLALALVTSAAIARADDVLHPGAVVVDRPTLVTLGVQLLITGDDNHDAQVAVRYRAVGATAWNTGLGLFRVRPEVVVGRTVPEQFAGSVFDLQPATAYEIELHATDADGPVDQTLVVTATTRGLPADPVSPSPKSVATAAAFQAALNAAQPGDVITLGDGTYNGPFDMSASGTAQNPIVIRGTSQDGTVLDGRGCSSCNLLELTGSFVHVERLTLQNALRGLRLKTAGTEGNVARRVHIRDVTIGVIGDPDQRDFYVCDNVVEGRLAWPRVYSDDGGRHSSDDGINVQGFGHVVCHNQIVGFGDAMKVEQDGARADDFYGNEVLSAYDNGIELDTSEGNTRAFRNRFTNTFVPLSFQPTFGGPVYAMRNVVVNVVEDQLKFYARGAGEVPHGVLVLHNTFVSPSQALLMGSTATSHHFAILNNLFVGPDSPGIRVADWTGPMDDGRVDFNGWFPDGTFDFHPAGTWSSFAAMRAAGVFESHGVLLGSQRFANGLVPPPTYQTNMAPQDVTLASGANAIDAGVALPNVNDGFHGAAPDVGALEVGCPIPLYGVRPDGIDETSEPTGCTGPTIAPTTSTTTTTLPWVTIRTKNLKLRDDAARPAKRRVTFNSSTKGDTAGHRIVPPAPGSAGDPTVGGATLTVYNAAGSGEKVVVALPRASWSVAGGGYRFRSTDPSFPISSVIVRADRLTVKGGKAAWAYTLDEPSQGRIAVRLGLDGDRPWCAEAPARAGSGFDRPGSFVGQPNSPPPAICPAVP